ncbi:phosphate-starvation-inducible PsiE family protein [Phormidium sp. CCY1219]|uniref:phosphate-starvation-inducible PsiE family protein n=1 Tax=Phormidium sp. CCY1219 TaxID=2886104 RepID=UPI002D76F548|nr:phosphate-starvation-inducible PsiE family protein [Phormidium sp. CCY1219]
MGVAIDIAPLLSQPAMSLLKKVSDKLRNASEDSNFLHLIETLQIFIAKILSVLMVIIIIVAIFDLIVLLAQKILITPVGFFNTTLFEIFGLFLNVLISIEILENITAYLKKHTVQVELVIVTSLVAVARKIIIFDLTKYSGNDLLGLAVAIFALSISYWIVRTMNAKRR